MLSRTKLHLCKTIMDTDEPKDKTIGFRGSETYRTTLQRKALDRGIKVQKMLEQAVDLYLSIPADKLDEVRQFVSQWKPVKQPREQKEA